MNSKTGPKDQGTLVLDASRNRPCSVSQSFGTPSLIGLRRFNYTARLLAFASLETTRASLEFERPLTEKFHR